MTSQTFAPGQYRCAKCGFRLTQMTLHATDGALSTRDHPGERCPNDGAPLWRMTQSEFDAEQAEIKAFNEAHR